MVEVADQLFALDNSRTNLDVSSSSSLSESDSVSNSKVEGEPPEVKKRKGVQFERCPRSSERTYSTSEYVFKAGKKWAHLATYFNCDAPPKGEGAKEEMNELLELVGWWDGYEKNPLGEIESDDDEIPSFAKFAKPIEYVKPDYAKMTKSSSSSGVSSLRLNSMMRLSSKPVLVANRKLNKNERVLAESPTSQNAELELAFNEVIETRSEVKMTPTSGSDENVESDVSKGAAGTDDFWGEVEF